MNTTDLKALIGKLGTEAIISYVSTVKLTGGKGNPQQGLVTKVTKNLLATLSGNGDEYQKRMQTVVDPNFVPKARPWGVRNEDGLIEHNGELYLEFFVDGKGESEYLFQGQHIDIANIVGLPIYSISEKEENTGIVLRCLKVDNILSVE